MKHTKACLSLLLLISLSFPVLSQNKEIIGYYPSWKWRTQKNFPMPAQLPFDKLTMIDYAFFYPLPDGTVMGRDSAGDAMILKGDPSLTSAAHQHGVKVLVSIGGWEDSNNFPAVASGDASRSRFAHSCLDRIKEFGFDGIDIDWEFPGYAEHSGTPQDRSNYTRLLRAVRDTLSAREAQLGRKLLLTAALPAGPDLAQNFEVPQIAQILDHLNVMTYDFSGDWDSLSGHNAPLFAPRPDDTTRNVDAAFRLYAGTYQVPAAKINLGVPFYGHSYSHCTSLYAPHAGSDTLHFPHGGAFYYNIVDHLPELTRYWDERAKVPYVVSRSWNTLVSYDDEQSVGFKAQYVLDNNAGGLIIWEITGDYGEDGKTPLLDVIASRFAGKR